jgi:hypothetical protein
MTSDIKITRQRDTTHFVDGGRTVEGVEVTFLVGVDGPFTEFLERDAYTPDEMRRRIGAKADNVRAARAHFAQ